MPEPSPVDPFDARLERAVHGFADQAQTHVDAAAVAARVARRRRMGAWAVLGHEVPIPVAMLLLLLLLLTLMIWTVAGGGPVDRRGDSAPLVIASAEPQTDGQGGEAIRGTESLVIVTQPVETTVDGVVRRRGGEAAVATAMNDPRLTGTGTWRFDADDRSQVGVEWGTYTLRNAEGAWAGTCTGGTWGDGAAGTRSCALIGSGGYAGYSSYIAVTQTALGSGVVEGVIYPGSPVEP